MTTPGEDLAIYVAVAGGLDAAVRVVERATGAHSFQPGRKVPGVYEQESRLFSLVGTPYESVDAISPSIVEGRPTTSDPSVDDAEFNITLQFPADPTSEAEMAAIVDFAAALGVAAPTVLADGDFPDVPLRYDSRVFRGA